MKLRVINRNNKPRIDRAEKPFLYISKTGLISLNKSLVDLLKLDIGDQIQFLQDEEDPQTWYLEVVNKDGFVLRDAHQKVKRLLTNSSVVVTTLFESFDELPRNVRLPIGEPITLQGRRFYTLITFAIKKPNL